MKKKIKNIIAKILFYRDEIIWSYRIRKIYNYNKIKLSKSDKKLVREHQNYWGKLKKKVNPKWYLVYKHISGNADIRFVPENIYHNIIEEKLNDRKLSYSYRDKNFYELYYSDQIEFPETILRNINGFYYDRRYNFVNCNNSTFNSILSNYNKVIIKPATESGGGKNISLFLKERDLFYDSDKNALNLEYLNNAYKNNFIIQNYLVQSESLAIFNPTSVNTVRIFSYRSVLTDEIHILHTVLRIGKEGNYIDDQNFGGIACKINDDSSLQEYATDRYGNKYYSVNGITLKDIKNIPKLDEMKSISEKVARKNMHSRLMGFDFALDEFNNVKLIEINNQYAGINFFQMNSSTVFGPYTDEVIEYCRKD